MNSLRMTHKFWSWCCIDIHICGSKSIAKKFYKDVVQERQGKIQGKLDFGYSLLIDEAPAISKEFIKLIKSDKIKPYTKSELFSNFYRVIERGWTDKKMAQQLHETREKIYALENGKPLDLTESPFDSWK